MGQIHNDAGVLTASERVAQAERLRKMLLAMVDDIRIVLIKLAERVQTLRFLVPTDGDVRKAAAKEVLELFAPLANRLGVWQIKWELEDLSLRALEPDVYKSIARALDERRHDREAYIRKVMAMLAKELAAAGIHPDVAGRPKHIYSIYKKMQRKGSGIDALYDIRAVRVLVPDVKDCYAALGVVHNLWTPLPSEFDDYIAHRSGAVGHHAHAHRDRRVTRAPSTGRPPRRVADLAVGHLGLEARRSTGAADGAAGTPRRRGQTSHGRMVSSGLSDVFGFVGLAVVPGDVFVVEASVVEASVKDADEVVAEGS